MAKTKGGDLVAAAMVLGEMPGVYRVGTLHLIHRLREGLPYGLFEKLQERLGLLAQDLSVVLRIPPRTLARRRAEGRFTLDESERLERLNRLADQAALVLGAEDRAQRWLRAPARAFEGLSPLQMSDTELGAREVERLLGRLEHGVFA